ncbi:MAG TPA: hypothetical protein VGL66_09385 [Caulobacteraceae bacterium]
MQDLLGLFLHHVGPILFVLVCCFAILKGETTERLVAGLLLVSWGASIASQKSLGKLDAQYPVMAIDIIDLLVFAFLAWKSPRSWPTWAAAFQAVAVAVNLGKVSGLRISGVLYILAYNLTAYYVAAALLIGTFIVWREREALQGKPLEPFRN